MMKGNVDMTIYDGGAGYPLQQPAPDDIVLTQADRSALSQAAFGPMEVIAKYIAGEMREHRTRPGTPDEDMRAGIDWVATPNPEPLTASFRVRGVNNMGYAQQDMTLRARCRYGMGQSEPTKIRQGHYADIFLYAVADTTARDPGGFTGLLAVRGVRVAGIRDLLTSPEWGDDADHLGPNVGDGTRFLTIPWHMIPREEIIYDKGFLPIRYPATPDDLEAGLW